MHLVPMRSLLLTIVVLAGVLPGTTARVAADDVLVAQDPAARFRSSVEMVRLAAVVRDRRGRFVQNLAARDFEVVDGGATRAITEFQHDPSGVSVAMLFDVSGSMSVASKALHAQDAGQELLLALDPSRDESAVFAFDAELSELAPFTPAARTLPA